MGESNTLSAPLVDPLLQGLRAAGVCGHQTRRGVPCRAPWNADTGSCGMGHGLSAEHISALRRQAGLSSHSVEAKVEGWARRIDWSTVEGVHDTLEMSAEMVMRKLMSPQQAGAIAQLAGVRLRPVAKPEETAKPIEVVVQQYAPEPAP